VSLQNLAQSDAESAHRVLTGNVHNSSQVSGLARACVLQYPSTRSALPVHYGLLIFPGFQALDAFGPIDLLNLLSHTEHTNLSIIASTLEPVSTQVHGENNKAGSIFAQAIVPTHTLANPPEQLDVLLVPGGFGVDGPRADEIAFIKAVYPRLQYLISVCNGSVLLARAGVLDGRRATTNK
jgi:transcriptional regulator GlxA family with amidase domain